MLFGLLLLGFALQSRAQCATEFPYHRAAIMQAVRSPHADLVLLSAHRGYWESYPENSWEAICRAGKRWEIVEADIKRAREMWETLRKEPS